MSDESKIAMDQLNKIDVSLWPEIWCSLNKWEIPEGITKPEWWGNPPPYPDTARSDFLRPLMATISARCGDERLNREWNKDTMTDEQHKAFYQANRKTIKTIFQ